MRLQDVSKSFGDQTIINHFSFLFKPGDRIGIVGNNGSGKSTLLNILAGRETIDEGNMEIGQTVKIGYYTQESVDMDENLRMIEYIRETADSIALKMVVTFQLRRCLKGSYFRWVRMGRRFASCPEGRKGVYIYLTF